MRNFLIHKNLYLYYWLKRRIGKEKAFRVANAVEKIILDVDILFAISFCMLAGILLFWIIFVRFLEMI